jgi:hypothetical protein
VPPAQAVPQLPQFALSLLVSTHAPVQLVRPVAHVVAHVPPLQTCPAAHAFPQPPQFAGSLAGSLHLPEQSSVPVGHAQPDDPHV